MGRKAVISYVAQESEIAQAAEFAVNSSFSVNSGNAEQAISSSYADQAVSSSYADQSLSSSYADQAVSSSFSVNAFSSLSSSYAVTASYALNGGGGGGSTNTLRHSYAEPYDYIGVAPSGTPESSPIWTITRLTVYLDGTALNQIAIGSWDNRASLIYT